MAINKNFKVKSGIDIGVANGTAPLTTISTTLVANLNVDLLDGFHADAGTTINTIPVRDSSGNLPGSILGNAATVTNGLYSTSTYNDPSWLTALSWSKISTTPTTLAGYGITDGLVANTAITGATATKVTYDSKGLILSGTTLSASDIPSLDWAKITSGKPTTLAGYGIIDAVLSNVAISAGTATKITYDAKGLVTAGSTLVATDIPNLDWAKITTGKPTTLAGYNITDALNIGGGTLTGYLILNADPTNALGAATKQYVDNAITGLDFKQSVTVATTANITNLSGGAPNNVDGVALAANNRVLVKNQTTASQNGIYVVTTLGTGANGTWTRATDADNSGNGAEVASGMYCFVDQGTTNASSGWVLSTANPITLGTTGLTFTQFTGLGEISVGGGLTKVGSVLSVATASSARIVINANNIDLATTAVTPGSGYNTFTVDAYGRVTTASTTAYLTGNQSISITGDATGTGTTNISLTLATVATAGTYPKVTINTKGLVTSGTSLVATDIPSLDWSKISTGKPTTLAGYGITDAVQSNTAITASTGTKITYDTKGLILSSTTLIASDIPNLDWVKITTGKPTTLAGYGITDAVSTLVYNSALTYTVSSTITTTSTATTPVESFSATTYRTSEYTIQVTSGTTYNSLKLLLTHDGTVVYLTEYAEVYNSTALGNFDADITGGNVRLLFTATSATSTVVKALRTSFTA